MAYFKIIKNAKHKCFAYSRVLCISTSSRVRAHPEAGRTTFFQPFSSVLSRFSYFFLLSPLKTKEKEEKYTVFYPPLPALGCYSQKLVAPKSWSYSLGFTMFLCKLETLPKVSYKKWTNWILIMYN